MHCLVQKFDLVLVHKAQNIFWWVSISFTFSPYVTVCTFEWAIRPATTMDARVRLVWT